MHSAMAPEFSHLANIICQHTKGRPLYYLAGSGNLGDALIRQGTLKFLREHGFRFYELMRHKGRVFRLLEYYLPLLLKGNLIVGGGGGWCKYWKRLPKIVGDVASSYRTVIVLPSTYEMKLDLPNIIYFSRDRYESLQVVPEAIFCHDMAFYLDWPSSGAGEGDGFFFRTDIERNESITIPPDNLDISLLGNHFSPIEGFFQRIDRYRVIHTDRLHVAIAACLLGKELHFYSNAYFKNKAVYLSSMKDFFEHVHFKA